MNKQVSFAIHFLTNVTYLKEFLRYVLSWIIAKVFLKRKVWLVCERGTDARDNGYWMFLYLQKNHPEIDSRYLITRGSEDLLKLSEYSKNIVYLNSFWFFVSVWQAQCILSAHFEDLFEHVNIKSVVITSNFTKRVRSKFIVRLQHGIIMSEIPLVKRKKADLFICGSKAECDYISSEYGFGQGVVQYTGLARYDQLYDESHPQRIVLIMPTWRHWLYNEGFIESSYFTAYRDLLCSSDFHSLLQSHNATAIFYVHHKFQKYLHCFKELSLPSYIIIAEKENYDVQNLLKTSRLLITDYSSVAFDFAYMHKPVIYYQFDEEEFRSRQFAKGYYDYHEGIGLWTSTLDGVIDKTKTIFDNQFALSKSLSDKIDSHFLYRDHLNCERIFTEIIRHLDNRSML